jgi:hypothetical protein
MVELANSMDERRRARRTRVLLSGKIVLPSVGVIDCILRNRSCGGARLRVESLVGIPDAFLLISEPDGARHAVEVVWRKPGEIGVRYV